MKKKKKSTEKTGKHKNVKSINFTFGSIRSIVCSRQQLTSKLVLHFMCVCVSVCASVCNWRAIRLLDKPHINHHPISFSRQTHGRFNTEFGIRHVLFFLVGVLFFVCPASTVKSCCSKMHEK